MSPAKGYYWKQNECNVFNQADKAVAEKKLSAAKPALQEAESALQVGANGAWLICIQAN